MFVAVTGCALTVTSMVAATSLTVPLSAGVESPVVSESTVTTGAVRSTVNSSVVVSVPTLTTASVAVTDTS